MSIIRAQAILKHTSGLPKHNAVNTFHFNGDAADGAKMSALAGHVRNFYTGVRAAAGTSLASFLSSELTTIDIKLYEVTGELGPNGGDEPTGPPFLVDLGAAGLLTGIAKQAAANFPSEVAICVSYQGTAQVGLVQARRRGRIYLGPLNAGAGNGGSPARPHADFLSTATEAFQEFVQDVDASAEFVVYSRPYAGREAIPRVNKPDLPAIAPRTGTTVNVDQFWIDDAFDTQRRRGADRTGRTLIATGA